MNHQEAKFILRAFRADGRYTEDPLFAEALTEAERDPELLRWLAGEQAIDATVARKIEAIAPPPDLRESILIGAQASRRRRTWWRGPWALAAAAAVVGIIALSALLRPAPPGGLDPMSLAGFGIQELATNSHAHDYPPAVQAIATRLATQPQHLAGGRLGIEPAEIPAHGCREVEFAGHRIFEICFNRDGSWFHLYLTPAAVAAPSADELHPTILERGAYAAAAWREGDVFYTLVTNAGAEVLRSVL